MIVLLLSLILDSYLKVEDSNKYTVVFVYGVVKSILFEGITVTTEIKLHFMVSCIFSIGSLLFAIIKGKQ
ncbi:hypothetical protein [Lederbergia graminis]|uniref:hypothetical protein n=1 Tax=Lederbergia graminis TaxID=735518 RepID=UPI0036D208CB